MYMPYQEGTGSSAWYVLKFDDNENENKTEKYHLWLDWSTKDLVDDNSFSNSQ